MNARANMQGFSLVELIAVIVLLAVGLVALLQVFGTAARSIGNNVDGQLGAQLAQERAERVLADRRVRGYSYMVAGNYPNEPAITGFANYARTTMFTPLAVAPCATGGTCQTVMVTVTRANQLVGQVTLMVGDY